MSQQKKFNRYFYHKSLKLKKKLTIYKTNVNSLALIRVESGGEDKLLAWGARGPGFEPESHHSPLCCCFEDLLRFSDLSATWKQEITNL